MIYSILWGDNNTASTRLRVLNIAHYIDGYVLGIPQDSPDMSCGKNGYTKDDTLIIQKKVALDELKKAKKAGARVIYDIDDYYDSPDFMEMIKNADVVTVDTEEKKKWLKKYNVVVIPDSLDWDGTIKKTYEHNGIVGWTGYGNNTHYLNKLTLPKGLQLRLITDNHWNYYTGLAQSRPWSLAMVDKYLSECDLGVYYLPKEKFCEVKGMHKLLKNWAIGLPTYTTAMPDYVKAMEEAGVGTQYIIKSGKEIKDIEFDTRLREYALKYSASNIAKLWEKVIKER